MGFEDFVQNSQPIVLGRLGGNLMTGSG